MAVGVMSEQRADQRSLATGAADGAHEISCELSDSTASESVARKYRSCTVSRQCLLRDGKEKTSMVSERGINGEDGSSPHPSSWCRWVRDP